MKRFINLQAGHQHAKNNCDPALKGGTGAPGEAEFTVRVRDRLSQILLSKKNADGSDAFTIQLVDATFNCNPEAPKQDYSLFLAIHYDADVYGKGGGFTDFPEPSTDFATKESQRIAKAIASEYFKHSGIEEISRSNANTRYYYMWKFLSANTPCVIIECGVGQNAHDKVILADTERVATAIARGICAAFGVAYDALPPQPNPQPQPTPNPVKYVTIEQFNQLKAIVEWLDEQWKKDIADGVKPLGQGISLLEAKLSKVKEVL